MNRQPDDPGVSDGCTLFPDGDWRPCCAAHDYWYAKGGGYQERLEADRDLRDCVADGGRPVVAWIMYAGVRLGGSPWVPFGWRWGKGGAAVWDVSHYQAILTRAFVR